MVHVRRRDYLQLNQELKDSYYIESINKLKKYVNDTYDLISILNEFNSLLSDFNCRLSSLVLNYILLLCVIDATLKKHNLIGKIKTESSSSVLSSLSDTEEENVVDTSDGSGDELTTDGSNCELTESENELNNTSEEENEENRENEETENPKLIKKKYQHYNI